MPHAIAASYGPDLLLLRRFLAVYRAGSIGRAASALRMSQPGLSKSLRRLERDLGITLFERRSTGVVATPYGHALARRAEVIEAEGRRALEEVAQIDGALIGRATIGVGPAIAARMLPAALSIFLEKRPHFRVTVTEGLYDRLVEDLRAGSLDFALTTRPFETGGAPGIDTAPFRRDRFVVACGADHPLATASLPLGEGLLRHPWVMPPRDGIIWQRFVDLFLRQGLRPPEPQVETNSTGLMLALIRTGAYLTFVPESLFAHEAMLETVTILLDPAFTIEREIVVLTRSGTYLTPASEALLAAFRKDHAKVAAA